MKRKLFSAKSAICILLLGSMASNSYARKMESLIESVERNKKDNSITDIIFKQGNNLRTENSENILMDYLELDEANHQLRAKKAQNPSAGITIQRFEQWYEGIKVEHGSAAVASKNGSIQFVHSNIYKPAQAIPVAPAITATVALQQALNYIHADKYVWQDAEAEAHLKKMRKDANASYYPTADMVWIEDLAAETNDRVLHLAYKFNVYAQKPMSRDYVYVDAVTGKILFSDAILKHVAATGKSVYSGIVPFETELVGAQYILHDQTRALLNNVGIYTGSYNGGATTTSDVTNATTTWGESVAIDAHWGAVQVYEYWKKKHARLSWDGNDGELVSYVNYDPNGGTGYNNAFWNGSEMTYGDGTSSLLGGFDPLVSLDVTGHEIGHGVCQEVCGLIYQKESGAMNEGFSDIWGETIEHFATPSKPMWQVGAEIGRNPLRSMSNPKLYGDPSTYGGTYWVSQTCTPNSGNDYCGVHTNSGVLNKWYYLLTDGESGTNDVSQNYIVGGIGVDKAAEIAFNTESMLGATDNYANCRTTSIAIATTMFGSCSAEVEAVTRAWHAVNVGAAFVPCGPQISFARKDTVLNKEVVSGICPASKRITIPVIISTSPTGGNATVTVTDSGSAKSGIDYSVVSSTLTFNAGSTTTQNIEVDIFDHGAIDTTKVLILGLKVTQNGSNAVEGNVYHEYKIVIKNNNIVPHPGGDIDYASGSTNVITSIASPLFSAGQSARSQFIIAAEDLRASGLKANTPITHISFNVADKKSTRAFDNYTIKMGQTVQPQYTNSFIGFGLTTYYSGSLTTTAGMNKIPLTSAMTWDGTSNIVMEVCFANATANNDSSDRVTAVTTNRNITAYNYNLTAITGCALPFNSSRLSNTRPLVYFTQDVPATVPETAAPNGRNWDVHSNQHVYFFSSANNKLVAKIDSASQNLGCVEATVKQQGNGFVASTYDPATNRSVKEFTITATTNGTTATHTTTIYLDTAELANKDLSNIRILKTNATTDAGMNTSNTQQVVPTITNYPGFKGFTGKFTGFSRFYLVDKEMPVSVGKINTGAHNILVDNNPFTNRIGITYTIANSGNAEVNMYDITGKRVYHADHRLNSAEHHFNIDLFSTDLPPAAYVLQIITPTQVLTQKMIKQ